MKNTLKQPPANYGVLVGRFSPLHLGHEALIREMIRVHGYEHSLLILGTADDPLDERTPFTLDWRKQAVRAVFPHLFIETIPDYPTDEMWMKQLYAIIKGKNWPLEKVVFWGGCEEDLVWFKQADHQLKVVNRYDGTTPVISATQVRNTLKENTPVKGLVSEQVEKRLLEF